MTPHPSLLRRDTFSHWRRLTDTILSTPILNKAKILAFYQSTAKRAE
jgi:hypothetical protein